jgi:hypothetical protein
MYFLCKSLLIFQIEKSEYSKKESVISSLEISLQQVRNTLQDTEYENVKKTVPAGSSQITYKGKTMFH